MAGNDGESKGEYEKDPRTPCKYGVKCYQKNPQHHKTYKHPPKEKPKDVGTPAKKQKLEKNERKDGHSPAPGNKQAVSKKVEGNLVTSNKTESDTFVSNDELKDLFLLEEDLPPSPEDVKESIKQKFLVDMPDDFYSFWSFCRFLKSEKPEDALKDVGLLLVGPYDVMNGKIKETKHRKLPLYLVHWRYYYDPPEFQTVMKGDDTKQYHMGYYRDSPDELPCFVASNSAAVDGTITPMAENIFGAVNLYLDTMKEKCDPFRKMKVAKIQSSLQSWAKEHNFNLDKSTTKMRERNKKVVTKTFHKAGIVVPFEKKTELGYRELLETDANLKKILQDINKSKTEEEREMYLGRLQPIVTGANIANDECDFGTSLELGLDLFTFGGEILHHTALFLLKTAYSLLEREEFGKIAEAHFKNRRRGTSLSIIK
ncbi:hypothetical protein L9F63_001072 [Diploptera punctata]|uniref:PBZ-type domain-containing protein n=1 Tax=Diploptera punctata TaxID=6984 RepID=A0AAD8ET71_DIPPU|nr:hypothetical protein L9F63_001072 [Diploptera punctata]